LRRGRPLSSNPSGRMKICILSIFYFRFSIIF
jgi:hypothetical protein